MFAFIVAAAWIPAAATYAVSDIGKPGTPALSRAQIAWAKRVATSRVYRSHVADLRFVMTPSSTPLTIYDACGGGWGEPRACPPHLDEIQPGNATFHVIGGSCQELLMLSGTASPHVIAGRDPTCDMLPASVSDR